MHAEGVYFLLQPCKRAMLSREPVPSGQGIRHDEAQGDMRQNWWCFCPVLVLSPEDAWQVHLWDCVCVHVL